MKRALIGLSLAAMAALAPLASAASAHAFNPQPDPPARWSQVMLNPQPLPPGG